MSLDASWIRFGRDHPRAIDPHHVSILPLSTLADENKPQPDFIFQAMLSSKVSTGIKAKATAAKASKAQGAVCFFGDAKKAAAATLAAAVLVAGPAMPARADLTSDLLARTEANKELNDKKRAATSSANFERSRTVTDGVCKFPRTCSAARSPPPPATSPSSPPTRRSSARAPATARCARPRLPALSPPSLACKALRVGGWGPEEEREDEEDEEGVAAPPV